MAKKKGDISKQLYKFQEGVTAVAIERSGFPLEKVHWPCSARPEGLSVDADVLIGPSEKKATNNISVKHWGGAKNSETAGWRMMREIIDSKANCGSVGIHNILFDDSLKTSWAVILSKFFDGFMVLPEMQPFGPILVKKAYDYCADQLFGMPDSNVRDYLRRASVKGSDSYDIDLDKAVSSYGKVVKKMVSSKNVDLQDFWRAVKEDCKRKLPCKTPRITSFKRGLAKFLILEATQREVVYDWLNNGTPSFDAPPYLVTLGLVTEDIDGSWEIADKDILRLFELFPTGSRDLFECIYESAPVERMNELYIYPLRFASNTDAYFDFVAQNFADMCDAERLAEALLKCYQSPKSILVDTKMAGREDTVWLYKTLIAAIKAHGGTKQSSGYSKLAEQMQNSDGVSSGYITLADFVNRKGDLEESEKLVSLIKAVARPLADGLQSIGYGGFNKLKKEISDNYVQRLLEAQLIPYRGFDPIGILLKRELASKGLQYVHHTSHPTLASEFSEVAAGGRTKVLEVLCKSPALILWQSPNKNARDKAKEFAARVACLKYKYNSSSRKVEFRGYKIYMVIDGIWDQEDIDSLLRFGCSELFYPDQMDELLVHLEPVRSEH